MKNRTATKQKRVVMNLSIDSSGRKGVACSSVTSQSQFRTDILLFFEEMRPRWFKRDPKNEVQVGLGGDSGAKESLIRECDCSGSAPGVLFGPIWHPFRGHFGSQNRVISVLILF